MIIAIIMIIIITTTIIIDDYFKKREKKINLSIERVKLSKYVLYYCHSIINVPSCESTFEITFLGDLLKM